MGHNERTGFFRFRMVLTFFATPETWAKLGNKLRMRKLLRGDRREKRNIDCCGCHQCKPYLMIKRLRKKVFYCKRTDWV